MSATDQCEDENVETGSSTAVKQNSIISATSVAAADSAIAAPSEAAYATPSESVTAAPSESATVAPSESATAAPSKSATISPAESATVSAVESSTVAAVASATAVAVESATVATSVHSAKSVNESTVGSIVASQPSQVSGTEQQPSSVTSMAASVAASEVIQEEIVETHAPVSTEQIELATSEITLKKEDEQIDEIVASHPNMQDSFTDSFIADRVSLSVQQQKSTQSAVSGNVDVASVAAEEERQIEAVASIAQDEVTSVTKVSQEAIDADEVAQALDVTQVIL